MHCERAAWVHGRGQGFKGGSFGMASTLRHLFATAFYKIRGDIVKLADMLGHSSIETTRIYLMTTGEEHMRFLGRMGLVI